MRLPIALLSISSLSLASACGDDDGGGASETTDTSGPSSTEESSSSVSVGESESSSSGVGEESSSSGVDGGSSSSGSESESESGSSGESSGTESGGGSTFACGDALECDLATEYCQRQVSDVVGMPDTYMCMSLPKPCVGVSECECLADEFCGEFCEEAPGGGATLSCPGG